MFMSLLDNDQYTFTQQQAILKKGFAAVPVVFKFKCRTPDVDFSTIGNDIIREIERLQIISLSKDEYDYLRSLRYFNPEYLNFLKSFRFDTSLVEAKINKTDLDITIAGPWFNTMPFEIPLLYIVSEKYCRNYMFDFSIERLKGKISTLPEDFMYAEFGTRRRACSILHEKVVELCKELTPKNFVGTSNLYLAKEHNIRPIGTMSHQWIQAHQQLNYRVSESQKMAFENWVNVYRGDLGYALCDTINSDAFFKDFDDPLFYKLFDGVREDSHPDPIKFGHQMINFYLQRKINPKTKTIIYSNGLNFTQAIRIHNELHNLINVSFGIGTNLTNDTGAPRLDIVIKMIKCNGQPVAKISNEPSKSMCEDQQFVSYLKSVFHVE